MPAVSLGVPLAGIVSLPLSPGLQTHPQPLRRQRRDPFQPDRLAAGPYRLPKTLQNVLRRSLAPFRNRDAAYLLASFLGRFWTHPERLGRPFPIDRRALTDHRHLGLTEAAIRGALKLLERVGFLIREPMEKRSRYRPTTEGLHRTPILFRFGQPFVTIFGMVNRWRERQAKKVLPREPVLSSPKEKPLPQIEPKAFFMGDPKKLPRRVEVAESDSGLEAALERLRRGLLGR